MSVIVVCGGPQAPLPLSILHRDHRLTERLAGPAYDVLRLVAGDKVFTHAHPDTTRVTSDPGDANYRTLEVEWVEQGVEQRLFMYLAADETDWWVDEIRTYDGFADGGWITYPGPLFRTPVGEPFYGDVHLVSDYGRVAGELDFDGLLLRPRFHLDFGGPDAAASPATE